ncbi:uncharacterized protein PGTG_15473 [Puccinia graminis f. sp. tritici CRL 75-36-700-3]|uniref:Uncharacterized protein n=1 Tax=Puccinia graminis f. sp. tritici (strain CRL 75-36-700-3 / race SCCL) TaxID=418459 RepID=E3KYA3_PUCGT|nr:uncharacterized protein PGTG_15473 [Puccinia graminis f. sp. tritici CRL 75-36-700-3]EFP89294.1 hypothetical protein PGTG_15473 [Puccinia graminis f. sp. tritici CRL 75-36-700-3]
MYPIPSLVFLILTTSLGLITAVEEQRDARHPFKCTGIHPVGYCGQKQGYKVYSKHHLTCADTGMKTNWCCKNGLEFMPGTSSVSQNHIYGDKGSCVYGRTAN